MRGFADVSVQEEAEPGNREAIAKCGLSDAVFACTMDRMMPYGDFSAIVVGFLMEANLVEGVAEGDRVE